jgi:hypothetical protein
MNRRGQEETAGKLGDFCVNCHAPLAVREGATSDGLNLHELPQKLRGVTCYFCHNVESVDGTHNNPVRLSGDTTLRGPISDPVKTPAHGAEYSAYLSSKELRSAELCGACHDIVTTSPPAPAAVELERTYKEWQESLFGPAHAAPGAMLPCGGCHMPPERYGPIAVARGSDLPSRTSHSHHLAGVDVVLSEFPSTGDEERDHAINEEQRRRVQKLLDSTLRVDICVLEISSVASAIEVTLDNLAAGHHFPSGASQDRRLWVEVRAYAAGQDSPVYQSGVIGPEQTELGADADLWLIRDRATGTDGNDAHMFWDIATIQSGTIPGPITADPKNPTFYRTHVARKFPRTGSISSALERVTVTVYLRPVGLDVLDDLIQSGHLDASVRSAMPTFDLIPNRHLAADPVLARLSTSTLEWSPLARESGRFEVWTDTTQPIIKQCIGMQRARSR